MAETTRAVVVDPEAPGRLVIREVPAPVPDRGEAIVRVRAIAQSRRGAALRDGGRRLASRVGSGG
jgi:NADPH:quinone reductase-like Zn-dependent oxidoreductase